jgi:hypothetical protein
MLARVPGSICGPVLPHPSLQDLGGPYMGASAFVVLPLRHPLFLLGQGCTCPFIPSNPGFFIQKLGVTENTCLFFVFYEKKYITVSQNLKS